MVYSINEIFYSIQGEGHNTGMPAIFIRFAGCNLKCPWCDTDHTKKMELNEEEILDLIQTWPCHNVILTGGEPSEQDLTPLLVLLKRKFKYYVAIETNGTNPLLQYKQKGFLDWVTVSPKQFPLKVKCWINEIKVIWPSTTVIIKQSESTHADYYYLQPCDDAHKKINTEEAIEIVKNNPQWRLSIQVQKIIGVR